MKNSLKYLVWVLAMFSFMISCSDDDNNVDPNKTADEQLLKDEYYFGGEINDVLRMGDEGYVVANSGGRYEESSFCASVELDKTNSVLTLDFGAGCTSESGRVRKGKIIFQYTSLNPLGARSIIFDDYEVDGTRVEGTITTSAITRNSNNKLTFTRKVMNGKLIFSDGKIFLYNADHAFTWTEGEGNLNVFSWVFEMNGSSAGTNREGVSYTGTITTPYTIKYSCFQNGVFYPVSGVGVFTPSQGFPFTVNFGDGSCDKKVSVTVGAFSSEVTLP